MQSREEPSLGGTQIIIQVCQGGEKRKKTYESTVHHRVQTSKFQNKAISRICQNAYLKKIMQDSLQNGIDFRDNRRSVSIRITGTSKHCGGFEWA